MSFFSTRLCLPISGPSYRVLRLLVICGIRGKCACLLNSSALLRTTDGDSSPSNSDSLLGRLTSSSEALLFSRMVNTLLPCCVGKRFIELEGELESTEFLFLLCSVSPL